MKHMWSEEEISSQKKDIATLVDSKGNPRFIEGEGTPATIAGFTSTYYKWSLSGTHLMIVLAGTYANGAVIPSITLLCTFDLPDFIMDKINPLATQLIEYKTLVAYAANASSQTQNCYLRKSTNLGIVTNAALTLTAERNFRIQFDLLIDSE